MAYIYLALAIIAEVLATSAIQASEGFTKPLPSAFVILGYGLSLYLLAVVLKSLPVGITYALWAGVGVVLVTIAGAVMYEQIPDTAAIIGMTLIVSGVIVINLFSVQGQY